jgi:hypothetical protein
MIFIFSALWGVAYGGFAYRRFRPIWLIVKIVDPNFQFEKGLKHKISCFLKFGHKPVDGLTVSGFP